MKLSGEATLAHGVDEVYAALNDPAVLVRTIPGCQRLEQVGPDAYKATVMAGIASIKGTFDGDVRLSDQSPPHTFTLHASGAGAPGTVSAVAVVQLSPAGDGGTLLRYDADATIGGVIGGVGQRMITGVAKKTANEFFQAVDRDLAEPPALASARAGLAPPETPPSLVAPVASLPALLSPGDAGARPTWVAPVAPVDPGRQRMKDVLVGAAFGAIVALLGVLVGAIVAGW
jgi:carbon monoxide dehydrogenase subunit G